MYVCTICGREWLDANAKANAFKCFRSCDAPLVHVERDAGPHLSYLSEVVLGQTPGIKTLREAGAKEIHMVVSCPPHRYPCYYGIDFSTKGELIACQHTVDEVRNYIGLDSLYYLSISGMLEATGLEEDGFCLACFDGKYPIQPEENYSKLCLE